VTIYFHLIFCESNGSHYFVSHPFALFKLDCCDQTATATLWDPHVCPPIPAQTWVPQVSWWWKWFSTMTWSWAKSPEK
jgi:hypothetical protein